MEQRWCRGCGGGSTHYVCKRGAHALRIIIYAYSHVGKLGRGRVLWWREGGVWRRDVVVWRRLTYIFLVNKIFTLNVATGTNDENFMKIGRNI